MDKEKMKKAIILGIIVFVLPVIIFGILYLVTPVSVIDLSDSVFGVPDVSYRIPNNIVALAYQLVALFIVGDFIIASVMNFMDKEKGIKQKLKEFFIKLIILLILFIALMLIARVVRNLGIIKYAIKYRGI